MIGTLMQRSVNKIIHDFRNDIRRKIIEIKIRKNNNKQIILRKIRNNLIRERIKNTFNLNPLSQLLDDTNALSEIIHKRKISCLGEGGVGKKTANLKIREIHPSQYGKLCPIETTEGKNAGLILSLAQENQINEKGLIETPYFMS